MNYARDERAALCTLLDKTGPAAATLCEGWATRDLAAHLVLRDRRPDAAAGVAGGPLAGWTRRVQRKLTTGTAYPQLVELVRTGPPRLSPMQLDGADRWANTVEFFVHHEDVRRAQPGWQPRRLGPGLSDELWRRLRSARFLLRKAPVGVEFARDDTAGQDPADLPAGRPDPAGPAPGGADGGALQVRLTAKARTPVVTVTGAPAELTLWAMGRTAAARVRLDGSPAAVAALTSPGWRS
jgi:uncharacterized protein (TIGR03085 family)